MDGDGQPLSRTKRYVLHFDKGELAPADAFWSVTLYDNEGLQVPNALDRFALGDGDKLTYDADGSLDFYVRADSPGTDKEPNWLPAPKGAFNLTMCKWVHLSCNRERDQGRGEPCPSSKNPATRGTQSRCTSRCSSSSPSASSTATAPSGLRHRAPPGVMAHADWIIDLGPGAGHDGGRIVFEGTPADLVAARSTLTGEHLAAYVTSH